MTRTDWPTEDYCDYRDRKVAEMHDMRARAINLARYYLRSERCEKAKEVLDQCSATAREMGEDLIERAHAPLSEGGGGMGREADIGSLP